MAQFGEIVTAMVTPFNEQLEVDLQKAKKLVSHLINNGTDSIVVSGTTGEGPTLSKAEKLSLFETVKSETGKYHKVIANVGTNNTSESISFAQEVEKLGVADALLLVNPYYNKPSQEGLYHHFKAIAESVSLPIMLYNVPGRTSVNLDAETTIRLAEIPNIVSIKEASGNLSQTAYVIEHTSDDFSVYSGDDNLTLPMLALGADGVVSVASHTVGKEMKEMFAAFKRGDTKTASFIHRKLLPYFEGIFLATNPVPIKHVLNLSGVDVGDVRLPLVGLTEKEQIIIQKLFETFHTSHTTI